MNPRTGPALAAALREALPDWTITVGCRASFQAGTIVRLTSPDGRLLLLTSRERRHVSGRDIEFYQPARPEHQGPAGFTRLVSDIRTAAESP